MIANQARDDFSRLHKAFAFHLGMATALSWLTALYVAASTPWVRNVRALIDPVGGLDRVESTVSYLFAMPAVLALAWISIVLGRESLRRAQTLSNVAVEFAAAAVVAFGVFYLSIDRAVTLLSAAS
ncbi:hypothetical protein [Methylobacterium aerolatum]|uniref:Yip1 domain-containing protein n=1 Tax=Methylobacterium aerolatum TaxID=418708 RepID=A0ABU0HWK8_9HYPH|nr:hypothetical protein [Methylobacterium aerolatum]MDQ0446719.1 hypothetical protein [Methylobacterium aerolatum]GJD33686.1 hypothetical protein FMGBMHLM_0579 [Methylobacterium aerolatum]